MQLFRLFATGRAKWSEFRLTLRGVPRKPSARGGVLPLLTVQSRQGLNSYFSIS